MRRRTENEARREARPLAPRPVAATALFVATLCSANARAENEAETNDTRLELYGHAMTDFGYNFGTTDPEWFDVMRPTKLPSSASEFGANGRLFFGVRQSRFGVKSFLDTPAGELKTTFEFELFGVAEDAGQTTFRLRHFYGELGPFGAGQTWSVFMDPDVFPDSIEYWGPNGMVFFRNVQIRWMPLQGDLSAVVAVERPGSSQDLGSFEETISLQDVSTRFPLPDFTGHVRYRGGWGHVQLAGIVRYIGWDDLATSALDLSGHTVGWGLNLSSNIKFAGDNVIKLQAVYGRAIENYMNDAGPDIAVEPNAGNVTSPLRGVGLSMVGLLGFVDVAWCSLLTSTAGYSLVIVDNASGQLPNAFKRGQYALANVLVHPTQNWLLGPEVQWGQRKNFSDGFQFDDFKIQFSMKYKFSLKFPK
jgi:hypothetical protein